VTVWENCGRVKELPKGFFEANGRLLENVFSAADIYRATSQRVTGRQGQRWKSLDMIGRTRQQDFQTRKRSNVRASGQPISEGLGERRTTKGDPGVLYAARSLRVVIGGALRLAGAGAKTPPVRNRRWPNIRSYRTAPSAAIMLRDEVLRSICGEWVFESLGRSVATILKLDTHASSANAPSSAWRCDRPLSPRIPMAENPARLWPIGSARGWVQSVRGSRSARPRRHSRFSQILGRAVKDDDADGSSRTRQAISF